MWSAAEPCRTRTLSLEMHPPPLKRAMGALRAGRLCAVDGSEGTRGEAGGLGTEAATDAQRAAPAPGTRLSELVPLLT